MKTSFLDFEQQIADLESKIESLRASQQDSKLDLSDEIERLEKKTQQLIKDVYAKLTPWQTAQVCSYRALPASLLAAGAALAASGVAAGAAAGVAAAATGGALAAGVASAAAAGLSGMGKLAPAALAI